MCHTSLSQEDDIAGSGRMVCVCCERFGITALFFSSAGISDVVEFFGSSSVEVFSAVLMSVRASSPSEGKGCHVHVKLSCGVSKQRPVSYVLGCCSSSQPRQEAS